MVMRRRKVAEVRTQVRGQVLHFHAVFHRCIANRPRHRHSTHSAAHFPHLSPFRSTEGDTLKFAIVIGKCDTKLGVTYQLECTPSVARSATIATNFVYPSPKIVQVSWDPKTDSITPDTQLPGWVFNTKLDQLIKLRGKGGSARAQQDLGGVQGVDSAAGGQGPKGALSSPRPRDDAHEASRKLLDDCYRTRPMSCYHRV